MITIKKRGVYSLFETKHQNKILILDHIEYAWFDLGKANEICLLSQLKSKENTLLSKGNYRMYNVVQEKGLTDHIHLELAIGDGRWKGYLLPDGLPTGKGKSCSIVPSEELITHPTEEGYSRAFLHSL